MRLKASACIPLLVGLLSIGGASTALALERDFRDAERLSSDQKQKRVGADIEQMKATLKLALERLEQARSKNDIIQVNCVNDKLSAIKGLLKISERADMGLREASVRKDTELVNHEFTKISIAAVRVENLRVEVEGCVGELSQYTGETVMDVGEDPDIRSDDPTKEVQAVGVVTGVEDVDDRPAAVSGSE